MKAPGNALVAGGFTREVSTKRSQLREVSIAPYKTSIS